MPGDRRATTTVPAGSRAAPSIWVGPAIAWGTLIALLAGNVALAWAPLGRAKAFVTFAVAVIQVGVMGLIFMRLNRGAPLIRLTAMAGLFWLFFLFAMSGADYFTRN